MVSFPAKDTKDLWQRLKEEKRPLVAYGMGNGADKLIARLESLGLSLSAVFASDEFVRGQSFHGMKVQTLAEVEKQYRDFLILPSFGSRLPEVMQRILDLASRHTLLMPDMPVTGETYFDQNYFFENYDALLSSYNALYDEKSKELFANIVNYKLTGEVSYLFRNTSSKEEIYSLIGQHVAHFVDVGAYRGDTAAEAKVAFPRLSSIVAVEPDAKNAEKLEVFLATLPDVSYKVVAAAASDKVGEAVFHRGGNRNSSLHGASLGAKEVRVPTVPLDLPLAGEPVDYIKFDVEGEEVPALLGTAKTIARARPILRVAGYHRTEDLAALPPLLARLCPDSRLYFRRTPCLPAWEADFIVLPNERIAP